MYANLLTRCDDACVITPYLFYLNNIAFACGSQIKRYDYLNTHLDLFRDVQNFMKS